MIKVVIAICLVACSSAVVIKYCNNYASLYKECIPPTDWICDALPPAYPYMNTTMIIGILSDPTTDASHFKYIQDCNECLGNPKPIEKGKYIKKPVCTERKSLVQHIFKTINGRQEICRVVMNSNDMNSMYNIQRIYRVSCESGDKKLGNRCALPYTGDYQYQCRPSNFVQREMLVYCPSVPHQLIYHKENIPTACSCVKVYCKNYMAQTILK